MQDQQQQQKPPSFPNLPKSALFSKLEAFLPVMAEENKKLSEAVAAGEGAKHNIEVEEAEEQNSEDADDAMTGSDDKKQEDAKAPVIEMNFALGTMDENDSDGEDADAADTEAQIKAATTATVIGASAGSKQQQEEENSSFQMRIEKPSNKPRPVIQELN
ncbi:hypothetical protein PHYSODRAFT_303697 [Phytophthora sojae]|uniref:Uncharacterized protein n=1 Tax=Phytophthora sojae (strain P6497) TaxID=1094619 RepID=G4ZX49_PHYSP|nr:hypothetical protein PHYSODRAFT_303697 [Phytophthora sojae]EGZ11766.1 hypothetical protein PHYSODRAFT_303697 [Phytophthora sojae]|eukprot:XP_009532099.1 hypothetical protein PHYSODRAFT_303697 [Phytophthora sojae]